ncbi:protein 4 [Melampyrum roseum virus 1]|uniref:Protein 4 n=1 Tax=Melampyrum roseum virus 1 TaxID=2793732 RepID=A0A8D9UIU5_9RHAB|nr:protein 4 [Melampyrum roseum virus 1]DAF42368.1 TPA_asm: protein 4 [Melampyrum roseum virus 1]
MYAKQRDQIKLRIDALNNVTNYLPEDANWAMLHRFRSTQIRSIKDILSEIIINGGCLKHDYMRDREREVIKLSALISVLDLKNIENTEIVKHYDGNLCWECTRSIIQSSRPTEELLTILSQRAPSDNVPFLGKFTSDERRYDLKLGCIISSSKEDVNDYPSLPGTPNSTVVSTIHDSDIDWESQDSGGSGYTK